MNGKFLLDTNVIINSINNKIKLPLNEYSCSIVTEMELLSFPKLTPQESIEIRRYLSFMKIININEQIKEKTIELRKRYKIKLPDSIICASAIFNNLILAINDLALFKIENLNIILLEQLLKYETR